VTLPGPRVVTFRSPGVAGDVLLLVVLIPIAAAAVAFLLAFPIVGIALAMGADPSKRALAWLAGAPAVAGIAVFVRKKLFWSLTLDEDAVVLGRWLPRRIPYERIRFVIAGRLADPMVAVGAHSTKEVEPFAFSTGPLRTERIFLTKKDADRCLHAMHQRSPHASAIDARGVTYGPRDGAALPYATFRAAEALVMRALAAFVTIAAGVGGLAVLLSAPHGETATTLKGADDVAQRLRSEYIAWGIVAAVPALAAYGVTMLGRARRVLRGEFDQSRT
jgi:hypothetical protein